MFEKARLKLTVWYMVIILAISLAFSFVIYQFIAIELDRFQQVQFRSVPVSMQDDVQLLVQGAQSRVVYRLGWINIAIALTAGALGYWLAGRTLAPIKDMVEEQNRFISDASHEIKTPLTSLKIAFEVFLRGKSRSLAEAEKVIADSVSEVNRLQSLSESLLSLAQYQVPSTTLHFENTDVATVLAEAVQKISPQAKLKRISVKTHGSTAIVRGHPTSLVNLFVVLLDNAIKYSPAKSTINITSKRQDGQVRIQVSDSGIGIAAKDLPHIFDRFYRADTSRLRNRVGGYGLGLAIAQKIVQTHKGSISVTSVSGKGATFTVLLPKRGTRLGLIS